MEHTAPIPANEQERLLALSEFDLDYLAMKEDFSGLAKLAARVTGTPMSHINLIDAFTQWTIGDWGLTGDITLREETVCHYTIAQEDDFFEVHDLSSDERFREKSFVKEDPSLRYYYGVPLKSKGLNIGSLCVLDIHANALPPEKAELLNVIAQEVVRRLQSRKMIDSLKERFEELKANHKKLAHDIRGPVGGVMGLAEMINDQGEETEMAEVLEFTHLVQKSCNSILDLAEDILNNLDTRNTYGTELPLASVSEKLLQLYTPQAKNKNINYTVKVQNGLEKLMVPRNRLFQITGNLICNAIKFTPPSGTVTVELDVNTNGGRFLKIVVRDSGIGMGREKIEAIQNGTIRSTSGTAGEQGFGFGLNLVKHLIDELNGKLDVSSVQGWGTSFEVNLPLALVDMGEA